MSVVSNKISASSVSLCSMSVDVEFSCLFFSLCYAFRKHVSTPFLSVGFVPVEIQHVFFFLMLPGRSAAELGGQERDGEKSDPALPSCLWLKQPAMDDNASLGKVSSSTESVATVTSEEFVLVQSSAAGSPQGSGGKPRLKVRTKQRQTFNPSKYVMPIPPGFKFPVL